MSLIQGGTIHPSDKSDGILYPSTPRYKEIWRPGQRNTSAQDDTCIVCGGKIAKHQGGHSLYGQAAHRKCMIFYTAWEVEHDHPGTKGCKNRMLQVGRNLEHLYRKIEKN